MKLFTTLLAIIVVLCVAAVVFFEYGGARGEVAKDKVLKKIDSWLGELDVARADVKQAIKRMEGAIDALATGRSTRRSRRNDSN